MKKSVVFISSLLLAITAFTSKKSTKMIEVNLEQFVADYIEAWSTKDAQLRKQLIEKVYSRTISFYADEPGDEAVSHHGLEEVKGNITEVNDRLVVGNGLHTISTGFSKNHDALRVTWVMKAPDNTVVLNGMNMLILNKAGKIEKDFIFIN